PPRQDGLSEIDQHHPAPAGPALGSLGVAPTLNPDQSLGDVGQVLLEPGRGEGQGYGQSQTGEEEEGDQIGMGTIRGQSRSQEGLCLLRGPVDLGGGPRLWLRHLVERIGGEQPQPDGIGQTGMQVGPALLEGAGPHTIPLPAPEEGLEGGWGDPVEPGWPQHPAPGSQCPPVGGPGGSSEGLAGKPLVCALGPRQPGRGSEVAEPQLSLEGGQFLLGLFFGWGVSGEFAAADPEGSDPAAVGGALVDGAGGHGAPPCRSGVIPVSGPGGPPDTCVRTRAGVTQLVEFLPSEQVVAGSSPVSRSRKQTSQPQSTRPGSGVNPVSDCLALA